MKSPINPGLRSLRGPILLCFALTALADPGSTGKFGVSVVTDRQPGPPARHGLSKILSRLKEKDIRFDQVESAPDAKGRLLLVVGLASGSGAAARLLKSGGISPPTGPEALLIRHTAVDGRPALLLAGADDRGLMYAELDVAERINWSAHTELPFAEVRDASEAPACPERALSIYTMQRRYFERRFYDTAYWQRYLDLLAQNRFNSLVLICGYENGGFLAPPYPYFFNVEEFPDVRMVGITPGEQATNLAALHRLIGMAHDRGIRFTFGIWDHIYRGGVQANGTPGSEQALTQPTPGLVWGVNADNLMPYTKAALTKFLRLVPKVDAIQFRMHDESGLKQGEQVAFWHDVFRIMKQEAPKVRFDARAKGLPDAVIEDGLAAGVPLRVCTKFWMEQMGLPFHPTHINPQNQNDRRHSYADLLRYPQRYRMHWRLWNGGTSRVLLWGDPEYARRFVESAQLYNGDGFEVNEPLCTKMQAQAPNAPPFDLLNPRHRYYDYEFERYWHFFQVFGRLGYYPDTPPEVWEKEFQARFGREAGLLVCEALHRASRVLPRIVAACYPYSAFPMTRGWAEKQRLEDLPRYAQAEGSDVAQFASFDEEARNLLQGGESPKVRPPRTSRWFAQTSQDLATLLAEADGCIGPRRSTEFDSTVADIRILSNLALFHARRIPAAVAYRLFERTGDLAVFDEAITHERLAVEAWEQLVAAAGDFYADDLMMGNRQQGLCGHWRNELAGLKKGLSDLEQRRRSASPPSSPRTSAPAELLAAAFRDMREPPEFQHRSVVSASAGRPLTLTATVHSPAGIKWVRVRYRNLNQTMDYQTLPMSATADRDEYRAVIPGEQLSPNWDFMYYLEAMGNDGLGAIFPDFEKQTPYVVVKLVR